MPRRAASASSSIHIHRTTPRPPPARSRLGDRHHYAWPIAISSTPAPRCLTSQIPQMTPCIVPRPPSSLLPLPSIAMGVVLGRLRKPYSKRATGHKPSIPPSLAHLSVRPRLHTAWQRRRCRCRCRRCCCCFYFFLLAFTVHVLAHTRLQPLSPLTPRLTHWVSPHQRPALPCVCNPRLT